MTGALDIYQKSYTVKENQNCKKDQKLQEKEMQNKMGLLVLIHCICLLQKPALVTTLMHGNVWFLKTNLLT